MAFSHLLSPSLTPSVLQAHRRALTDARLALEEEERAKRKAVEVLFGETPPAIVGIAIMSDADNTGEQATAWYGDLVLTADQ
mgnify:CR=1 FL=1